MEEERHEPTKLDYYLAQIATEVRRSYVKKPGNVKLKDFLITFKTAAPAKPVPTTAQEKQMHIARSKAAWLSMFPRKKNK